MVRRHWWVISGLLVLGLSAPLGWTDSIDPARAPDLSGGAGCRPPWGVVCGAPGLPGGLHDFFGPHPLHPAFDKLGRGVSNALFGWLEIPATMGQRFDERNTGGSLVAGFAYGIVRGVIRTGVGVYETVTLPMPIPEHYAPIVPTLAYFDKERKDRPLPLE